MPLNYALRGTLVLAGLRLRRLRNWMSATHSWGMSKLDRQHGKPRIAAAAKAGIGWLLMLCVTALMVFSFGKSTQAFLFVLHCQGNEACAAASPWHAGELAAIVHVTPLSDLMTRGMTMLTSLLAIFSVLYPFALARRSGPGWDFEWIATLPMTRTTQLCARIAERAVANPIPWFAFVITNAIVAWYADAGWLTPLYSLLIAAPLVLLVASIWSVLDLGLHIALAPAALRNLQRMLGLVLSLLVCFVMSVNTPGGSHYALLLAGRTPAWAIWTPPGVAVQILRAPFNLRVPGLYALLLAEAGLITLVCIGFLRFQLRKGLVVHGTRESGHAAPRRAWR
jgi:ABC-2 type transport system permease protein